MERTQWEYKAVVLAGSGDMEELSRLLTDIGHQEWELATSWQVPEGLVLFFKRPSSGVLRPWEEGKSPVMLP